ncbi:MAG: DUF2867 domain-containing protein [Verrucomicrobiaceae bacterium]|nr:MAG: DUF2867 domain-containing protein [Verrucomicrobiaceae bacterium]
MGGSCGILRSCVMPKIDSGSVPEVRDTAERVEEGVGSSKHLQKAWVLDLLRIPASLGIVAYHAFLTVKANGVSPESAASLSWIEALSPFRVSFFLQKPADSSNQKRLAITTMVQYNSARGRFSFLPLQPLHKLVVNAFLKNAVANLGKKYQPK